MSDTDDTDDLLLIPPDQHVVSPEAEVVQSLAHGAYFQIVDTLIGQVNKLNSRVQSIERIEVDSFHNTTASEMEHTSRYKSSDDLLVDGYYNSSTFSTPQKPRMRYRTNSQSPHKPRGRFTASFSKYPYKSDYPELELPSEASDSHRSAADVVEVNGRIINLTEIENMLEEIELQKKRNDQRIKDQEVELQKSQAWRMGDDPRTLPPTSGGDSKQHLINEMATDMCDDFTKMTVATLQVTAEKAAVGGAGTSSKSSGSSEISGCTQIPARQNTDKQENNDLTDSVVDALKPHRLLSLKELWGDNDQVGSLMEKLEEEKLRRQHCEDIIQELQTKSLELQERVAVAVQVDRAKDNALEKFHNVWQRLTARLKSVMDENSQLHSMVQEAQEKHDRKMQEFTQKIQQYKMEAANALSLAHGSHEKLTSYMDKNTELHKKLEYLQQRIKEIEVSHEAEKSKCKQLNEIIVQKELDLSESKNVLNTSRQEVATSKKAIELCQVEFTNMKAQYKSLEENLTEKNRTINELEAKVKALEADNDNLKILQKDAQTDLESYKQKMDKTKSDLRDFYQQQVELLVQDKLKEFQTQLDRAETSLQDEIYKREMSLAKTAATHIQQITEKHNLEIKLLEEKQKEEIKYYQMQLQQSQQQILTQQNKLKHQSDRRAALAQQLHKVMEVQWMEALKIINNTKSPYSNTPIDSTLDQLRTLKAQSQNNLEEMLSDSGETGDANERNSYVLTDTPVSSKTQVNKLHRDNSSELQKYVNLLMNKQSQSQIDPIKDSSQTTDLKSEEIEDRTKPSDRRHMKPPWK